MKWSITCFANIKYMNKHILPISTILSSTLFFNKHPSNMLYHFDKNDVLLGITCNELSSFRINVILNGKGCPCKSKDYQSCEFLKTYYEYLKTIDFKKFINKYEKLAKEIEREVNYEIEEIVIMVYEKEGNNCSERTMIRKWFNDNGVRLEEFYKYGKNENALF